MSLRLPKAFLAGVFFALVGCVALPPEKKDIGVGVTAFTEKYGPPTSVIETSTGKKLIYWTGPFGEETYFVEVNTHHQVTSWRQVLTEENFRRVSPGLPLQKVTEILGPCSKTYSLARDRGSVCAYRYRNPFCHWFSIEITAEGTVRSAGYLSDPKCDDGRFGLFRFGF